jgi:hypothetical protein
MVVKRSSSDRRLKWVSGRVPDGYEAVGMAKPG